jgi:hypothetical protein
LSSSDMATNSNNSNNLVSTADFDGGKAVVVVAAAKRKPTPAANTTTAGSNSNRIDPETALQQARSLASDPQWSHRLRAFESLIELTISVDDSSSSNNNDRIVQEVSALALQGLQDSHQKIMIEAARLLSALLLKERGVLCMRQSLQELLAIVFVKLTDSRALIRDAAASLVSSLKSVFEVELLVDATVRLLTAVPDNARLPALQFLCGIMPAAREVFSDNSNNNNINRHVRDAVSKLSWLTTNKESNRSGTAFSLSIKKILSFLWEFNAEVTNSTILLHSLCI